VRKNTGKEERRVKYKRESVESQRPRGEERRGEERRGERTS